MLFFYKMFIRQNKVFHSYPQTYTKTNNDNIFRVAIKRHEDSILFWEKKISRFPVRMGFFLSILMGGWDGTKVFSIKSVGKLWKFNEIFLQSFKDMRSQFPLCFMKEIFWFFPYVVCWSRIDKNAFYSKLQNGMR